MKLDEMINKVICGDCLSILKSLPDKCIDLVFTDPPYGIGADKGMQGIGTAVGRQYDDNWDTQTPPIEVFNEILRVGKKVIILGGNFFTDKLPVNGHWIVWDKKGGVDFDNNFGDCELAWTNIDRYSVKKYFVMQQGFIAAEKQRWHPTQKPVNLMEAIIADYTELDELILDCFAGSGSTLLAAKRLNRKIIGIETSEKYCKIAEDRLRQGVLKLSP